MSISIEIHGKVRRKSPVEQVTDSFKKQEIVILVADDKDPKYDDYLSVQFSQDRCAKLDSVNEGDEVKIQTNLRGKQYTKKDGSVVAYFNSIEGWKIEVVAAAVQQHQEYHQPEPPAQAAAGETGADLPF